ncbi:MAG: retropepsin-like aspartic protease [Dehalococcoidia bacterium]|nr:retropepsin-like aspartic protease [Dehalococcoidia bacterium]
MSAVRWKASHIPVSREFGGVFVVQAVLNGVRRARLMADTGAAWTSLTRSSLEKLGVDVAKPASLRSVAVADSTASITVPVFRIDSVRVGTTEVSDLDVIMFRLPDQLRLDGLLGINFLEHFRATFDFRNVTLVLRG